MRTTTVISLLANGVLPTRGSVMLDLVVVAMALVLPCLFTSIYFARQLRKFRWHRTAQIVLSILLLLAVVLFEVDMRIFTDWRQLAEPSPFYESGWVDVALWIHLGFAIPTPFVWGFVIAQALRHIDFENDHYRATHKRWAWWATAMMVGTAVTGWVFYWIAFVS